MNHLAQLSKLQETLESVKTDLFEANRTRGIYPPETVDKFVSEVEQYVHDQLFPKKKTKAGTNLA